MHTKGGVGVAWLLRSWRLEAHDWRGSCGWNGGGPSGSRSPGAVGAFSGRWCCRPGAVAAVVRLGSVVGLSGDHPGVFYFPDESSSSMVSDRGGLQLRVREGCSDQCADLGWAGGPCRDLGYDFWPRVVVGPSRFEGCPGACVEGWGSGDVGAEEHAEGVGGACGAEADG